MTGVEQTTPSPTKMLVLDLLYPAVLGAMVVFLFLRLAAFGIEALKQPATHFGVILGVFYALGFVAARLSPAYTWTLALIDCFSSILMFVCFYTLGLNQDQMPQVTNYGSFYLALLFVVLSPMLRRFTAFGQTPHLRNGLALLAAVFVVLALLGQVPHGPFGWVTPWIMVTLLYIMLVLYILHIPVGGVLGQSKART